MFTTKDEYLHKPSSEPKWRESYYFNWVDLDNKISGFSTIGIVPNESKREFVFLLFTKEKNEVYYREPPLNDYSENVNNMLADKRLSYKLITPFKLWQLEYKSHKLKIDISFETRFPTFSFGTNSSASWHKHFEASGTISGKIHFKNGKEIKIRGFGQRDKSWGFRDWHQFDSWYAGHFQFKDWSATFRKDYRGEIVDLSGNVSTKNQNIPIQRIEVVTITDSDQFKSPISTFYEFEDSLSNVYEIKATRMFSNSYIRFTRDFSRGFTELFEQMAIVENLDTGEIGSGMMEHLRTKKNKDNV